MTLVARDGFLGTAVEDAGQSGQIDDRDAAGLHLNQAFGLQAHQVSRNQLANGAELVGQVLMRAGKLEFNATLRRRPVGLGQPNQRRHQPLTHRGEREFLDNAHQAPQPRANHGQHLQRNFRVLQTEAAEVIARDEQNLRVFDGTDRRRIGSAIEDGQLGNGTAGALYRQDLFAAAGRALEDTQFTAGDDVKALADIAFLEQQFALRKAPTDGVSCQQTKFIRGKIREERNRSEGGGDVSRFGHGGDCNEIQGL